jgi:hypothetical protein
MQNSENYYFKILKWHILDVLNLFWQAFEWKHEKQNAKLKFLRNLFNL